MTTDMDDSDRTIGQLVAAATEDISTIVRSEIALAKAEMTAGAKTMGAGIGMFAGAAFVGLLGLIFLFNTIAWVIAVWLPVWAGYLITTGLLLLVAGVLALLGRRAVQKAQPKPERAIKNAQETVDAIRSPAPRAPAASAEPPAVS